MIDQWTRVGWSLQENYSDYLKRSYAERMLLQDSLSEIIESTYGDMTSREAKKKGL